MATYVISVGRYISPYVRKFWSKRLYYNRPTTSIRSKLRAVRTQARKVNRRFSFLLRDLASANKYGYRFPKRITQYSKV